MAQRPADAGGRVARVGAAAALAWAAVAAVAAVLPLPGRFDGAGWGLAVTGAGAVVIAALPARAVAVGQTAAVLAAFAAWRVGRAAGWELAAQVALPLAAAPLAMLAPATLAARRVLAVAVTLALLPLLVLRPSWDSAFLGASLQLVLLVDAFGRDRTPRSWHVALRAACGGNATVVTPFPPEDLARPDLAVRRVSIGAAWVAGGALLLGMHQRLVGHVDLTPWGALAGGERLSVPLRALLAWGHRIAGLAGVILVDAGALAMLGLPLRAPVDAPWRSRDFLDYWRRANTYRYRLLVDGFFRPFFPARGAGFAVGVVAVFLVSGLHHAVTATWVGLTAVRWAAEGVLAAGNALWNERVARSQVGAWLTSGAKPRRRNVAVATLVVLVAHGLLLPLAKPAGADILAFKAWFGGWMR